MSEHSPELENSPDVEPPLIIDLPEPGEPEMEMPPPSSPPPPPRPVYPDDPPDLDG